LHEPTQWPISRNRFLGFGIYCVELVVYDVRDEKVAETRMDNFWDWGRNAELWLWSRQRNGLAEFVDNI
jgi:hypothetical protein